MRYVHSLITLLKRPEVIWKISPKWQHPSWECYIYILSLIMSHSSFQTVSRLSQVRNAKRSKVLKFSEKTAVIIFYRLNKFRDQIWTSRIHKYLLTLDYIFCKQFWIDRKLWIWDQRDLLKSCIRSPLKFLFISFFCSFSIHTSLLRQKNVSKNQDIQIPFLFSPPPRIK